MYPGINALGGNQTSKEVGRHTHKNFTQWTSSMTESDGEWSRRASLEEVTLELRH